MGQRMRGGGRRGGYWERDGIIDARARIICLPMRT